MKKTIKLISTILVLIQIIMIIGNFKTVNANIKEGDIVNLKGDHECNSLVEYLTDTGWWSYKIVWYVYYIDSQTGEKYPAFCVEPAKQGVGTGYDSYNTTISKETDNCIWRILSKGYMGTKWTDWNLECDDDFYSATKIALHSYKDGIAPKTKYIIGNRSVDGNSVETIQRRGQKVLDVAQTLYEYGLYGSETYQSPQISIKANGDYEIETIDEEEYYIQNYKVTSNKKLKSYEISIKDFVQETKILNSNNEEVSNLENSSFKIAIPTKNIKESINGKIYINNAEVKTCPIYYAKSWVDGAQSYVTYTAGYEVTNTSTEVNIDSNTASLEIIKVDKETNAPIENVTFEVFDEAGQSLGKFTTNKEGLIQITNLKPGVVNVKEIKVNDKYILDSQVRQVELNWGQLSKIEIENEVKKEPLVEEVKTEVKLPRTGF